MTSINAASLSAGLVRSLDHPLDHNTLNPQPLPPREQFAAPQPNVPGLLSHSSRLAAVALNPQPLPPRDTVADFQPTGRIVEDEQCGTVPRWIRHLPPLPPHIDHNNPGSTRGIIIVGG